MYLVKFIPPTGFLRSGGGCVGAGASAVSSLCQTERTKSLASADPPSPLGSPIPAAPALHTSHRNNNNNNNKNSATYLVTT